MPVLDHTVYRSWLSNVVRTIISDRRHNSRQYSGVVHDNGSFSSKAPAAVVDGFGDSSSR